MSNFLQLHSHFVEQESGGFRVNNLRVTVTLGDGSAVQFALPCMSIGGGLVVVPAIYIEGQTSIRMDFGHWTPGYCGNGIGVTLPYTTTDQALAVRICRAFHTAPDTSWSDSKVKSSAWVDAWVEEHGPKVL